MGAFIRKGVVSNDILHNLFINSIKRTILVTDIFLHIYSIHSNSYTLDIFNRHEKEFTARKTGRITTRKTPE